MSVGHDGIPMNIWRQYIQYMNKYRAYQLLVCLQCSTYTRACAHWQASTAHKINTLKT